MSPARASQPPPTPNRPAPSQRRAALDALRALHEDLDRDAARVAGLHAERIVCKRGCAGCCLDDLTVRAVEAERIRSEYPEVLAEGEPAAIGGCAFLDEAGACRVYAARPSVCRSQGLPLRVFFEDAEGEIQEQRDICPLNEAGGPALDALPEEALWLVGPPELRLEAIDAGFAGEDAPRVSLRSLFGEGRIR